MRGDEHVSLTCRKCKIDARSAESTLNIPRDHREIESVSKSAGKEPDYYGETAEKKKRRSRSLRGSELTLKG